METRKPQQTRFSPLPDDYVKMVGDVFATNFDAGLKRLKGKERVLPFFQATGRIFPDEVVLSISLMVKGQLAATSVHASCDFDARASAPTIQDLLSVCVDAAGTLFTHLFSIDEAMASEKKSGPLTQASLSAFKDIPFDWTVMQVERHKVYVKVDKSNPSLDEMADEWLRKHDPRRKELELEEEQETENLFVTGKSAKGKAPH